MTINNSVRKSLSRSAVWLAYLTGLVSLLSVPLKQLPEHVESFLPFEPDKFSHIVAIIIGFILFYIGGQLAKRKKRAHLIATISLSLLIIAELLYFRNILLITLYSLALTTLILSRKEFTVRSDDVSLKRGLMFSLMIILASLFFGVIAFSFIDQRDFGRNYTTVQALRFTVRWFLGLPNSGLKPVTRQDYGIIDSLRVAGITSLALILASLFRPMKFRFRHNQRNLERATEIMQKSSDSPEDFFKIWPGDKHYYFHFDSFLAYTVTQGVALVIDGPTGNPVAFSTLLTNFQEFCKDNDWQLAIIHASNDHDDLLGKKLGLSRTFIGNEAPVNLDSFVKNSQNNKHFRYIRNKGTKEGLSVQFWKAPLDNRQLEILSNISSRWLAENNRREYTFIMGYFDEVYLAKCDQAVLYQNEKPIAYINFIPSFVNGAASIDHMRFVPGSSSVNMHYLLLQSILHLRENGWETLNLGLAPLSGLEERENSTLVEKLLAILKRVYGRYYSFEGLEQFKNKFSPNWEPRYIYYQGGPQQLVRIAAALNTATSLPKPRFHRRHWPLGVAIFAGLAYASFPLAFWLNKSFAFHGLVSDLGANGQPYAPLFNTLDVISGGLFIGLAGYFLLQRKTLTKAWLWAISSLGLSGLGTIVAALLPLPTDLNVKLHLQILLHLNPVVIMHGLASFVNTGGFIVSLLIWLRIVRSNPIPNKRRLALGYSMLGIVVFGPMLNYVSPSTGDFLQRIFICLFALWVVIFTHDALSSRKRAISPSSK